MDNKKITFITCVNDEVTYKESIRFIDELNVPKGFSIEKIAVRGAKSMTSGYNEAMSKCNSKYKVYLHQDVFIIDRDFINNILKVFRNNNIGIIGAAGCNKIKTNGVWWENDKMCTSVYHNAYDATIERCYTYKYNKELVEVQAIDGLIMVTQKDYKWREDLFDGWHFYDVSQSLEFIKNGNKVVVLNKKDPWVIHDCGITWTNSDEVYEKYRIKLIKEYSKLLFPLVSIMITAYNRPTMFKEALESALAQEYINKEIIIVDNSTNDLVKEVVVDYKDYSFINYYKNEKELDVIDNFNKAIQLANGEYISFLMDDNIYSKDKINKMMDYFLDNEGISMVTSYSKTIDVRGNTLIDTSDTKKLFEEDTILNEESIKEYFSIKALNFLGETTTPIFKKSLLNEGRFGYYRGKQYNNISDLVTWINMSEKGKVIYIAEPLSYFRIHSGQDKKQRYTLINRSIEIGKLLEVILFESNSIKLNKENLKTLFEQIIRVLEYIEEQQIDEVEIEDLKEVIEKLFQIEKKYNKSMITLMNKRIKEKYNKLPQEIRDRINIKF